jgi:UDP-perosamine 4-acetyltransferase
MRRVVGIGAGGHAKILVELLQGVGGCTLVGFTDPRPDLKDTRLLGVPILGDDSLLPGLRCEGVEAAFVGVGATRDVIVRKKLYELATGCGFEMITLVHPRAYVAPSARLGRGTVVLPCAVVNTDVTIGDNVTVYSGVIVEHDSVIGDHVHLSPGVHVAGGVAIGQEAFVGIGASIIQGIRIGAGAIIGAGAAVIRDVPAGSTAVGVPARILARAGMER